jgi:hypothetical protein
MCDRVAFRKADSWAPKKAADNEVLYNLNTSPL